MLGSAAKFTVLLVAVFAAWNDGTVFVQQYRLPTGLAIVGIVLLLTQAPPALRILAVRRKAVWLTVIPMLVLVSTCWFLWTDFSETTKAEDKHSPVEPLAQVPLKDHTSSTLRDAALSGRDLSRIDYSNSLFEDVDMSRVNLTQSSLKNATFSEVSLTGANLCGADARGADFRDANGLRKVSDWNYLLYDESTRWPRAFDIEEFAGPVLAWTGSHLLSCEPGTWTVRKLS